MGETANLLGHAQLTMVTHYSQDGEAEAALDSYRRMIG